MKSPTQAEIERALCDEDWGARYAVVRHMNFLPTTEQLERGLRGEYFNLQEIFNQHKARWQSKIKAHALQSRHAQTVEPQKLKAL